MVFKSFDKKIWGGGIKNDNMPNQELAEELHKPIIRKFKNWIVVLADMQLISKFNREFFSFFEVWRSMIIFYKLTTKGEKYKTLRQKS